MAGLWEAATWPLCHHMRMLGSCPVGSLVHQHSWGAQDPERRAPALAQRQASRVWVQQGQGGGGASPATEAEAGGDVTRFSPSGSLTTLPCSSSCQWHQVEPPGSPRPAPAEGHLVHGAEGREE